ncbi:MFS transporter [Paenibacillus solani]|uniref:MFS transporter n=1 Tax=Paenibacillus solani TaxID=1705565 RepID=UPI003D2DAB7D
METETEKSQPFAETVVYKSEERSVFKNRTFLFFLFSIIFTSLTTPMYMLVEGWYVVDYLNKPAMLGFVLMVTAIPRLLLMSVGGVMSDRFPKSKIMFLSDFIRFLILATMAVLMILGLLNFWVLLACAALFGTLEAFYWPAAGAIIPTIVKPGQLRVANSVNIIIQQLGSFAGPAFAGLLIAFGSFQLTFAILGLLLFLGAVCLFFVREPFTVNAQEQARPSMMKEIKEGMVYIKKDSFKLSIIITAGIAAFFVSGPVSVAFPTLVKEVFRGSALDLTYLQTSFALGSIAGGVLLGLFRPKGSMAIWAYSAFILLCLGIVGLGSVNVLIYAIIISVFTGLCSAYGNMMLVTVYQLSLDQDKLGRGMSLFTLASTGLYPISAGIVPLLLTSGMTISTLLMLSGSIAALILFVVVLSVKGIRRGPQAMEQGG